MPNSNWRGSLTLALVALATVILGAGVVGAIMSEQYTKRHQNYADYQENAEADRRNASKEIAKACEGRTSDDFRFCLSDRIESYYRDQAANQDLQAQQDMAYWAAAMFFSSTVLTGVGIYLLFGTLAATRETLKEARLGTKAAQDAVEETRRIGEAQVRAYMGHASGNITFTHTKEDPRTRISNVFMRWKNYGGSPAKEVFIKTRHFLYDENLRHEPLKIRNINSDVGEFQGNISAGGELWHCGPGGVTAEDTAMWIAGKIRIILFSRIRFEDVFEREWTENQCLSIHCSADLNGAIEPVFETHPFIVDEEGTETKR